MLGRNVVTDKTSAACRSAGAKAIPRLGACVYLLFLAGCGTQVPSITEFWGGPDSSQLAVNAVGNQIQCELKHAVLDMMSDKTTGPQVTQMISKWVVQVNLTLTIEEKTELNPGVTLTSPFAPITSHFSSGNVVTNPSFSFGIGLTSNADTTRILKITSIYKISELAMLPYGTNSSLSACIQNMPTGYLMTQTDLKIEEALREGLLGYEIQASSLSIPQQAIVHQVTFKIQTAGGLTPTWKLLRVTASNNAGTSLFSAARNRTQDVIFTFGPAALQVGPQPVLAQTAQNAALAAEIGSAVAASLQRVP